MEDPDAPPPLPSPADTELPSSNQQIIAKIDDLKMEELNASRSELLSRVQNLKKDLQEWRGKLDGQVKTYREELGELRKTLNMEVDQLKTEFQELRTSLRKQLDTSPILEPPVSGNGGQSPVKIEDQAEDD